MIIASILSLQAIVAPTDQLRDAERAYQSCLSDGAKANITAGATVFAAVRAAEPGCKPSADALRAVIYAQPTDDLASVLPVQQAKFEEAKRDARMVVSARLRRQQVK